MSCFVAVCSDILFCSITASVTSKPPRKSPHTQLWVGSTVKFTELTQECTRDLLFPVCWKDWLSDFIMMQIFVKWKRKRMKSNGPSMWRSVSPMEWLMAVTPSAAKPVRYFSWPLTATYWEPFQDNLLQRFRTRRPQSNTTQTTSSQLPPFLPSLESYSEPCQHPAPLSPTKVLSVFFLEYGSEVGLFFQQRMTMKEWHRLHCICMQIYLVFNEKQ